MAHLSKTKGILSRYCHSHLLIVSDAQTSTDRLLEAIHNGTFCGIRPMRLALSSSDSHVGALGDVTPLASRSVFAAQPVALGVLFAARIFANAALSSVLDANSYLDDTCVCEDETEENNMR